MGPRVLELRGSGLFTLALGGAKNPKLQGSGFIPRRTEGTGEVLLQVRGSNVSWS